MIIPPALRLQTIEEYYFSRKLQQIRTMVAAGIPVINLGIGSPDLPPPEAARARVCSATLDPLGHGYQSYRGTPEFRSAISRYMATRYRAKLDPATEILPLPGSKQGMIYAAMAFVNPGDGVLIPDPGYPTYTSVSHLAGGRILPYPLDEQNGWEPAWAELERMDLRGVKLMWVNYPHMPTGAPATEALFSRHIDFARRHGILICHDNPYSQLVGHGEALSILAVPGAREVAVELNSLSKSHNMAGWRIGWFAGRADYIETVLKVASNVESGMFLAFQQAAITALESGEAWYDDLRAEYARRRTVGVEIMRLMGCTVRNDQAGMFVWAGIPGGEAHAEAFADRVLDKANVFIVPGSVFGSRGSRHIRLSLCSPVETLRAAATRVAAFASGEQRTRRDA